MLRSTFAKVGSAFAVTVDGHTQSFAASGVGSILLRGSDGNDTFTIKGAAATVPVSIDGGGGTNTASIDDSADTAAQERVSGHLCRA